MWVGRLRCGKRRLKLANAENTSHLERISLLSVSLLRVQNTTSLLIMMHKQTLPRMPRAAQTIIVQCRGRAGRLVLVTIIVEVVVPPRCD